MLDQKLSNIMVTVSVCLRLNNDNEEQFLNVTVIVFIVFT